MFKYRAFVSYSRADSAFAHRLHRWLEEFRVPLGADTTSAAPSLGAFFVDVAELAAGPELSAALKAALDTSEALIVVCSASAAQSKWVEAEIVHFCTSGRSSRIVPILAPLATYDEACVPRALRYVVDQNGIGTTAVDRIVADTAADGEQVAFLRVAAGLLGVGFNDLSDRHAVRQELERRKRRRLAAKVHTRPAQEAFQDGKPELALKHALACVIEGDDPSWSEAPELEATVAEYACSIADRRLIRLETGPGRSSLIDSVTPIMGGRYMLVGSRAGGIFVRDGESGDLVAELVKPNYRRGRAVHPILKAVLSPDERTLAMVHQGCTCSLWSTQSWKQIAFVADGSDPPDAIAFSHDCRRVAIGNATTMDRGSIHSVIRIVDLASGEVAAKSDLRVWDIWDLAFSSDDAELVVLTRTGGFLHLDPNSAGLVTELAGTFDAMCFGELAPDGTRALIVNSGDPPSLWRRAPGRPWQGPAIIPHGSRETLTPDGLGTIALHALIAPDWKRACISGGPPGCTLWDLDGFREIARMGEGHRGARFSPDGKRLALQREEAGVGLFDGETGAAIAEISHDRKRIHLSFRRNVPVFSQDGACLVVEAAPPLESTSIRDVMMDLGGQSIFPRSLRIHDAATGAFVDEIAQRGHQVDLCGFAASGLHLWALVDNHELRVRSLQAGRRVATFLLAGNAEAVFRVTDRRLCFSPDGSLLAAAEGAKRVEILDPLSAETRGAIELDDAEIGNFAFAGNGSVLVVSCDDGSIRIFDPGSWRHIRTFQDHPDGTLVDLLVVSHDGTTIASASAEDTQGPVAVRSIASTGMPVHLAVNDGHEIKAICFAPGSERLALIAHDGEVAVWDIGRRREITRADPGLGISGFAVAFANGGSMVAAADQYGKIRSFDAATGETVPDHDIRLENKEYGLDAAAFTPDGAWLIAAEESVVHIINVETGEQRILGNKGNWAVPPIAVSPSGRLVATGSGDGAVRLWRVHDGQRVSVLWRHSAAVMSVAFSADERMLASVDMEGFVHTWDIQAALLSGRELTAWLCIRLGGNLATLYGVDFEDMLLRDVVQNSKGESCDLVSHILSQWPDLREIPLPEPIRPKA